MSVIEKPTPVLWIDLDGTVRYSKNGEFVNKPEDVEVFLGVPKLLADYKRKGWRVVAVSNQGGIALGYLTLEDCMKGMMRTQELCGNVFDRMACCRHHPSASDQIMSECWCRKPRIGLLVECGLSMAEQFGEIYPPHMALFVGDREEDKQCAENAGINFMWAADWRGV